MIERAHVPPPQRAPPPTHTHTRALHTHTTHSPGDDKYRPCPLLAQYVDAGWVGKKSGRGVYEYPAHQQQQAQGLGLGQQQQRGDGGRGGG